MNVEERKLSVEKLVSAFKAGSLVRNPEYQRGEAWSLIQKATFIDSLFRSYPVPALFFHVVESPGLDDEPAKKYEIVDGQQRLTSLRDFRDGKVKLLDVGERSKLRVPKRIRAKSAPWAGKYYADLSTELQREFENREITVFQIGADAHPDEVRDLFIRLQSGTALSRQQIRDAWPGNLGPYIEHMAGKLDKPAANRLFTVIDKRGQRSEDEDQRDYHVADRQTCAQLLRIFLARERDPYAYPSVSANDLDSLYHEYTDFEPRGELAQRFEHVLSATGEVFEKVKSRLGNRAKFRRLDVTATMMFIQGVTKSENTKIDKRGIDEIAKCVHKLQESEDKPSGKSTAGSTLQTYYAWWRDNMPDSVVVRLDPKRTFDAEQRKAIRVRDAGKCAVCSEEASEDEAEYDHYPVPYRDGGRTVIENGRLVHTKCHPRGRPAEDA